MTDAQLAAAGAANLRRTYLSLGLTVPGARRIDEAGFTACLGEFTHPICNFAAGLRLDPWSARRLRDLALERASFHVYTLADDEPAHVGELLERQGFVSTYRLVQMAAEPGDPGPYVELAPATTPSERLQVATFMGSQFLTRADAGVRRKVAAATSQAPGLEFFELRERGGRLGAVMLSRAEGVIGLYNLCIAAAKRGKGLGRSMVAWARATAAAEDKAITLQCDARLADWYEHLGFRRMGVVDVYILDKMQQADIMN